MSIAKTGALQDSYKYVNIAIDSFDGRLLQGRICHDSLEEAVPFGCISEMAICLENLFDELRYPMKSVDQRSFAGIKHGGPSLRCGEESGKRRLQGKLAEFCLHVKYRFHSTWQGNIRDLRNGGTYSFQSFLELMEYLDRSLGQGSDIKHGLGKRMCEVAVRNFSHFVMGGDVSHPAVADRREFASEFELRDEVERLLLPLPEGGEEGNIISPRSVMVNAGGFGPMTFVIRIMFRRNATWQGTICWKEKRRQISFRSFLEMLLLMQEAVADSEGWNEELKAASGHAG